VSAKELLEPGEILKKELEKLSLKKAKGTTSKRKPNPENL